ncbi:MAG: hypothetical protein ACT4O9_08790 [Blastocatellia bacterium]
MFLDGTSVLNWYTADLTNLSGPTALLSTSEKLFAPRLVDVNGNDCVEAVPQPIVVTSLMIDTLPGVS